MDGDPEPLARPPEIKNPDQTDLRVSKEIQSSSFLNLSICFFNLKQYQKSIEYAHKSNEVSPSVKAFFRKAQGHKVKHEFTMGI